MTFTSRGYNPPSPQARTASLVPRLHLSYLDPVDVHATHAAAAVDEKDEFTLGFPEVGLHSPQIRAEIQHDDRVVGDVLVEAFPYNLRLPQPRKGVGGGGKSVGLLF